MRIKRSDGKTQDSGLKTKDARQKTVDDLTGEEGTLYNWGCG